MAVADGQIDPVQAPLLEFEQEVAPAAAAFAVGQLHTEHFAPAVPVDPDGDQNRPGADDAIFADLFVARVEDQVGIYVAAS
jgi:hypothetical protein